MMKKAREIRKKKMQMIKKQKMAAIEEARNERQQIINKNFFEDDKQWDMCCEDFKILKD